MTMRRMIAFATAAALGAAACRPSGSKSSDSSSVGGDSSAGAIAPAAAVESLPARDTTMTPRSEEKPAPRQQAKPKPAPQDTTPKPTPTTPGGTSPAPGVPPRGGQGRPALIVFRDTLMQSDLDWLRAQGFTIVHANTSAHSVSIRIPDSYSGNPKSNPRVLRINVMMR